jgi:AcrR family transcriptional regulator
MEGMRIILDDHPDFVKRQRFPWLHPPAANGKARRIGVDGMTEISASQQPEGASPARPGTYSRGAETVDAILKAALEVLIEEGAAAFTIRRIANACGMKVGNVSYHFPRKEMLVQILLDEILVNYDGLLDARVRKAELSAEDRLRMVITMCLEDIARKRTTRLFTELWALANHNEAIAERVRVFYQGVHQLMGEVVAELNPALPAEEVEHLARFISTSMEGATPFLGFGKPWAQHMPAHIALTCEAMVALVKSAKAGEIAALTS